MGSKFNIRLKKGDTVIVRAGKYKGNTGKITSVLPELNQVVVEGINIVKKHQKPSRTSPQGGIVEITKPIAVSKVGYYDSTNKKATKIGFKFNKDGKKVRILKSTGKEVSTPKVTTGKK